jgi:hypothetical protein
MMNLGRSRSIARLALVALLPVFVGCQSVQTPPEDKQWGTTPQLIDDRAASALRPQIAIDVMGNAIAVWDQTDQAGEASDDIWSNRRDAGGQWGEAQLLESHEPDDSVEAQIAVDGEGNAVVVFRQSDAPTGGAQQEYYDIWTLRHGLNEGWDPMPERIESNDAGDASRPQVAVDPQGNAVVVWQHADASDESLSVWANRFVVGSGWGDAGPVETDPNILLGPQVAIDAKGNAIVVWEGVDNDDRSSIWSRRLTPDGDREALLSVEGASGNAFSPQVAADAEGNAIAVWQQQTDGSRVDIWSNRYVPSAGWGDAERIETADAGDSEKPQVAMDGDGNAIAVWVQLGGDRAGVWSSRYVASGGWRDPTPIGPAGLGSARAPQVSTNPNGDAVAIWVQFDGLQDRIYSNRYTASGRWGRSRAIDTNERLRVQGPQVAVDFEGNAVAVWSQENDSSSFDVWSNRLE